MKNLLLSATLLVLVPVFESNLEVFATQYEDATHAKSNAQITFVKDTEPSLPTDPEKPEKPVEPVDPTNPNGAELMITYASKLNFGKQSKNKTASHALADRVKEDGGTTREIVPFIATKDSRGSERKGWSLTAKQDGDFKDSKGNILEGAELTFKNLGYANTTGAPTAISGNITINNQAKEISFADVSSGVGNWSVSLGKLTGEDNSKTTDGVILTVPSTTAKNTDTYTTTLTYELVADPSK